MSTKSMIVLLSLACLIGVLQVTNAFKFTPCDGTSEADILSIKVDSCPDTSGDCCSFDYHDPPTYELQFKSLMNYKAAFSTVNMAHHNWMYASCKDKLSCPGKAGDVLTDSNTLGRMGDFDVNSGDLTIRVVNEKAEKLVCVRFPACANQF